LRILNIRESSWQNATPAAVWRRILALEEWPDWHNGFLEARWLGRSECRTGWREGHRFRLVTAGPRRALLRGGTVTSVVDESEVRWVGRYLTLKVEFSLALSAEGVGSRVEFCSIFRGLAVRIAGQDTVARTLSQFQRRFLAAMRESGERVGVK
jgi:Polyketide cyclase / dehydrase and lipid transport